jgi:hypothetical protein
LSSRPSLLLWQNFMVFFLCGWIVSYCTHWDWKLVQSLWETLWRILRNLKIGLPHDPAIPLVGIYLKEMKSNTLKRYLYTRGQPSDKQDSKPISFCRLLRSACLLSQGFCFVC